MKNLFLTLVFVFAMGSFSLVNAADLKTEASSGDCFDFAIEMLQQYDEMSDGDGANIMNEWYAICWCLTNDDPISGCF